jgi:hypothetical protein
VYTAVPKYLGQEDAIFLKQVGAAGAQRGLAAEICHNGDQAVPQPVDHHPLRYAGHQAQRVDVAPNLVQQCTCERSTSKPHHDRPTPSYLRGSPTVPSAS